MRACGVGVVVYALLFMQNNDPKEPEPFGDVSIRTRAKYGFAVYADYPYSSVSGSLANTRACGCRSPRRNRT
jgi:hypothetical protein